MTKLKIIVPITFVLVVLDQFTKLYVFETMELGESFNVIGDFFRITYIQNPGAILGMFSEIPFHARIAYFIVVGMLGFVGFLIYFYLLEDDDKLNLLVYSGIFSGITGNFLDRIWYGYVVDFVHFSVGKRHFPVFNMADTYLTVSLTCLIIISIFFFKDRSSLRESFEDIAKKRGSFIVNWRMQFKFSFFMFFFALLTSGCVTIFGYYYMEASFNVIHKVPDIPGPLIQKLHEEKAYFLNNMLFLAISISLSAGLLGVLLTHRIAGPVYAFQRFLKDIVGGKNRSLKLRTGDEFKELETLADQVLGLLFKKGNITPEADADKQSTQETKQETEPDIQPVTGKNKGP